jgi:hypothetical protein
LSRFRGHASRALLTRARCRCTAPAPARGAQVQPDDARMSKWALSTVQFGQTLEFAWLARDLTPVQNQKACRARTHTRTRRAARHAAANACCARAQIHWVSQGGLPNRGAVTFFPRGPDSCALQLSISYELPQPLLPVGEGVRPVVESILMAGASLCTRLSCVRTALGPCQACRLACETWRAHADARRGMVRVCAARRADMKRFVTLAQQRVAAQKA